MKPIYYLTAFSFVNHTALAAARVLVALYGVFLGASATIIGILVALFALLPMIAAVPFGRMADRRAARGLLTVLTLLMSAGLLVPFFWQHTAALFVTGTLVGGAYFAINILTSTLAGRHGGPGERAANFSWVNLGIAAGNGVGPLFAGFAIDHIGFRAAVLCIALFPLMTLLLIVFNRLPELDSVPRQPKPGAKRGGVMELLMHPEMFPVYMMGVYFMLSWDIFLVMTPVYGAELHISASNIGIIVSAYSVAVFVVRVLTVPMSRLFTPWQIMLLSLGLSAVAILGYGLVSTVIPLVLLAFVLGFGQGLGTPMAQTALFECSPPDRYSEALGLRVSVGMACQFILPMLAGSVASLIGIAPIIWLVGVVLLIGAYAERRRWSSKIGTATYDK